jgi:hypothetical protein
MTPPRVISQEIEQNILKELAIEKKIIQNKQVPLTSYNYSYLRDRLRWELRVFTYGKRVGVAALWVKLKCNDGNRVA